MAIDPLQSAVESLRARLTPAYVRQQVQLLLDQGQDVGGGINASRLVRHLLGGAAESDEQVTWAYEQLRPTLSAMLEQIPSLYYFEGD
jgi:hypothetical protein